MSQLCLDKLTTLSKRQPPAPPPLAERCGLRRLYLDKLSTSFVQESWASSEYWFRMCICLNMIITPITSKSPIIAIIVCLVSDVINTQRLCNSLVIVFQFNKIPPLSNVNNIKTNAIFLLHLSFINNSL